MAVDGVYWRDIRIPPHKTAEFEECVVLIDVVGNKNSVRCECGPGTLKFETHSRVRMLAVVYEVIERAGLADRRQFVTRASPA